MQPQEPLNLATFTFLTLLPTRSPENVREYRPPFLRRALLVVGPVSSSALAPQTPPCRRRRLLLPYGRHRLHDLGETSQRPHSHRRRRFVGLRRRPRHRKRPFRSDRPRRPFANRRHSRGAGFAAADRATSDPVGVNFVLGEELQSALRRIQQVVPSEDRRHFAEGVAAASSVEILPTRRKRSKPRLSTSSQ